MRRFLVLSTALLSSFTILGTGVASASPPVCTGGVSQQTLFADQGSLESVIVGGGGSLYVSGTDLDGTGSAIFSYTKKGPKQDRISPAGDGPGGLAWDGRRLLWGSGNTSANGLAGDLVPQAGLYRVNLKNGKRSVVSDHLGMGNGIARAKDGTIYASNSFGQTLDRISPQGKTRNGWATVPFGNGLTIGRNGRYLYAAQTLVTPSTIAKIDTRDPSKVFTYYTSPEPANVLFDGLARDNKNNLYVAILGRGEVWKVTPDKQACVLASGLTQTTAVTISTAKRGYRAGNLYAVGFDGKIVQVKGAVDAKVPS
ncbi:MAG: SMP-30/gluconolactonase/LRE family protein, partial [Solirubrobacterales bacterium]